MNMPRNPFAKKQSGAALVVGLLLLLVLTLLAISSMNTASLDLIMAGNEQYQARAFQAAEAGVQDGFLNASFNSDPTAAPFNFGPANTGDTVSTYRYTVTPMLNGEIQPPPPGNSEGTFGALYFRIQARGDSARGARADHTQELYQVMPTAPEEGYAKDACANTTALEANSSGCS